jgi:hypothetical protein
VDVPARRRGPIGSEGPLTGIEVSLGDGRLGDYSLPTPPSGDDLVRAICASLRFLELAPLPITVPLLRRSTAPPSGEAAPWTSPWPWSAPPGTQKTELTAMAQAHYGGRLQRPPPAGQLDEHGERPGKSRPSPRRTR